MLTRAHVFAALAALSLALAASPPAFALPEDTIEFTAAAPGAKPRLVTMAELEALPKVEFTTRTPWHKGPVKFAGVKGEDLMALLAAKGETMTIEALDAYTIKVPTADFAKYGAIFAYRIDDKDLTVETKGPLFLLYPFASRSEIANETYYARCIWQIAKLDVR